MMQIVINIPKDLYKATVNGLDADEIYDLRLAVANGVLLPKGHGRIADMDGAIKCIEEVNGEDAVWAIGLINWACGKRTILGADDKEL